MSCYPQGSRASPSGPGSPQQHGLPLRAMIGSGGRYDSMIGSLLENKRSYPAVGISFGLDRIYDALEDKEVKKSLTQVFIISINEEKKAIELGENLRRNNFKTELDIKKRSISSSLDYASKMEIPFVVFLGKEEMKKNKVKLRNMKNGKEKLMSVNQLFSTLKGLK